MWRCESCLSAYVLHCIVYSAQDLSSFVAKSVKEVEHVMNVGGENRKVG